MSAEIDLYRAAQFENAAHYIITHPNEKTRAVFISGVKRIDALLSDVLSASGLPSIAALDFSAPAVSKLIALCLDRLAQIENQRTYETTIKALFALMKSAYLLGQIDRQTYDRLRAVHVRRGEAKQAGRHLEAGELKRLLKVVASGDTMLALRNRALLHVLNHGLRADELCSLRIEEVNRTTHEVLVHGKGNYDRTVTLRRESWKVVEAWLDRLGRREGALFMKVSKGDRPLENPLRTDSLYHMVAGWFEQAGLEHATPHDFRRKAVSTLRDNPNVDDGAIMRLTGHKTVRMLNVYDRRAEKAMRRAVEYLED